MSLAYFSNLFVFVLVLMQVPSSVLSSREAINKEDEDIARAISMSIEVFG